MRKSHTIPMGIVLLFANQNLGAQTNQQQEFARQANNLFSSDMDAFFDWFTAPSSRNLLLLLMGLSFFYFLSMLTLFVLVNKQVFSIKEKFFIGYTFGRLVSWKGKGLDSNYNRSRIRRNSI